MTRPNPAAKEIDLSAFDGHSDGPWERMQSRKNGDMAIITPNILADDGKPAIIAEVYEDIRHRDERSTKECQTNAAAIAKLPALLAELKSCREQRDELAQALFDVVDACASVSKPWDLEGYGITPRRAEEICSLAGDARAALLKAGQK